MLIDRILGASETWATWVVAVTWQLALLAMVGWMCERALRLRQPGARYGLWWFVLAAPLVLGPARMALERMEAVVRVAPPAVVEQAAARVRVPVMMPGERAVPEAVAGAATVPEAPWWSRVRPADVLAIAWVMGCLMLVARLVVGHARARRLVSESHEVTDGEALGALGELCAEAGVRREVGLRVSGSLGAPVLYGVRRPTILLPEDWMETLAADDLRALLAHEVAHVRRHDFLANLIQRFVEIPLFFHPGAWLASRRITLAREELCDEWALARGVEASSYARSLAAAAERARGRLGAAAVGIAESKSMLRRRVEAIMRASTVRRLSRPGAIGLAAILLGAAAAFAAVQLAGQDAGRESAAATLGQPYSEVVEFAGRVRDEEGRPVEGAAVWVFTYRDEWLPFKSREIAQTDEHGSFSSEPVAASNTGDRGWSCWVAAHKPGCAVGWIWVFDTQYLGDLPITLGRPSPIRGKVVDRDGVPVVSAVVRAKKLDVSRERITQGQRHRLFVDYLHEALGDDIPEWALTRTGPNGEFELADMPGELLRIELEVQAKGYAHEELDVRPAEQVGDLTIQLAPEGVIEARVLRSGAPREPAAGISVHAAGPGYEWTRADEQGRYRLERLKAGSYTVWAEEEQWSGKLSEPVTVAAGERLQAAGLGVEPHGRVEGRVLEAETGEPIPGVSVSVRATLPPGEDGPRGGPSGRTGPDGRYVVWGPPGEVGICARRPKGYMYNYTQEKITVGGREFLRIIVDRDSASGSKRLYLTSGEVVCGVDLFLRRAAAVAGVVVGPDGKPWDRARVEVTVGEMVEGGYYSSPGGLTRPDGTFSLERLMPDVPISLSILGEERRMGRGVPVTPVLGEVKRVEIQMLPLVRFRGRAVLPDGRPAAGAKVSPWYLSPEFDGQCDAEGRFEVLGAVVGLSSGVTVELPSLAESSDRFVAAPGQEVVDVGDLVMRPVRPPPPRPRGGTGEGSVSRGRQGSSR